MPINDRGLPDEKIMDKICPCVVPAKGMIFSNTSKGRMTLDNFITIEEGKSPQRIQRENGDRINHVKASVIPGVTTTEIQKIVEQTLSENLVLPDSVKIQYQGEARDIESFGGAFIIVIFGFFFATVSSRMVGLVGSSNNPVSGMAIATLLIATLILKVTGAEGVAGMCSAIAIGSIICIVSAIAGDTSQNLKTGYILGATPRKQQTGELIGVIASALAIGGTLYLLDSAWGFGSDELGAPQATLMKLIVEGVMGGDLPWTLVFIGVFIAVAVEIIGIPVLPFAIGVYLPVQLNACIMVGGLIRLALDKIKGKKAEHKEEIVNDGILFCSGMIAGEGLVGIVLALLAVFGVDKALNLSEKLGIPASVSDLGGLLLFALIVLTVLKFTVWKKRDKKA